MADWLDDLAEFPAMLVAEACQRWRRQPGSKRPLPGDIRAIVVELKRDREQSTRPLMLPDHRKMEAMASSKRQRVEEARAHREQWAREHGCEDFQHALSIDLRVVAKLPNVT